ncbi:hypothetical protein [Limosilactobacillus ingluviei]|uniref:hypothetical protein n=1 Tax=Limosilactobacillus ingluviei TaxID=148604 RepID=UPI00070512D4|nr:hypothetical protein [Limosilactobacillus ingluviei]
MSKVTIKLPTRFEKVEEEANDTRFQKVRIYIAHTGENLNNSIFSREVLEDMIPSLVNVPILGYVAKQEDGEKDFRGHEKKVVIEDNSITVKFMTSAYGFIPEENNAHFEITGGKEWLVADGVLWTRFTDAMSIFDQANGSKAQSMEISNADGYQDDRGRMVFTKAEFTGLCILGDDTPPAMKGSTISTIFSQGDNLKSMFEEMIAEYSAEKGVNELPTKKKDKDETTSAAEPKVKEQEPAKVPAESKEKATSDSAEIKAASTSADSGEEKAAQPADKGKSSAEPAGAGPEAEDHEEETAEMACGTGSKKKKKTFKKEDSKGEDPEKDEEPAPTDGSDDKSDEEPSEDDKKKSSKTQFELNLSDRERKFIYAAEANLFPQGNGYVMPVDIYEDYGVVNFVDKNESAYIRFNYTVGADDSIQLSDKTEVFPRYLTAAEVKKVEDDRNMAAELQKQIDELQAYKNGIEMSKKSEILEGARDSIENEQYQAIKAQFEMLTPEEVEKEVAFAIYKNGATFQKTTKSSGIKTVDFNVKTDYGYGSANALFHK